MKTYSHLIPVQVAQMLDNLLNRRDSVHLRSNYRMRLDAIRREIDLAIREYDAEVAMTEKRKA